MGFSTCQSPAPITPALLKGQLYTLKCIAGLYGSSIFVLFVYLFFFEEWAAVLRGGCVGKTSECLSWEQRGRDQARRNSQRLLTSLETISGLSPPRWLTAHTAFTWSCPLRPHRALFQLSPTIVPTSSPPTLHVLCLRTSQFPSHLHHPVQTWLSPMGSWGHRAGFPHPPVPRSVPRVQAFASGCLRLVPPFGLLVSTSRLPAGSPGRCGLRPSPLGRPPRTQS